MKIVVDAFGGDNAPLEIIIGAIDACAKASDLEVVLVGDEDIIHKHLAGLDYNKKRLQILDAKEVISNDESPTEAIRRKPESTIVKAYKLLNSDDNIKAFVSCGSTGAVLTGAVLLLKRVKGINRPALAPILPTVSGGSVVLIDCGANTDCKPLNLQQFAYIGSAYAASALNISKPRVGLLSNGTEDKKGNDLTKEVFQLLKEDTKINFVGNMEAREILSGNYDVIVADGFAGNIALKASEGAALTMFDLIKSGIMNGGLRAKIGYLLLKPVFKKIKGIMDYNNKGGAVLLGLDKLVIKSHGSSKAKAVTASILQAKMLCECGLTESITKIME